MKKITDAAFKYTPSHSTDIRKLFERIRREQKANAQEAQAKVKPIKRTA